MSKDKDIDKTDIGEADKVTMDSFMRTLIAKMFENDNDLAELQVVLNGTDSEDPPTLTIEMRLTAINGSPTRSK